MADPLTPKGVVVVPPDVVHIDIHDQVSKFLKTEVKDGQTMAMLALETQRGVNFAVAHKAHVADGFFEGDWVVESWIGKSGWDGPLKKGLNGGVQVMWST